MTHGLATMEVAIFKGLAFPGKGPWVLHRSPLLTGWSQVVLCIDAVS
jgi:hypothetical protein